MKSQQSNEDSKASQTRTSQMSPNDLTTAATMDKGKEILNSSRVTLKICNDKSSLIPLQSEQEETQCGSDSEFENKEPRAQ